MGGDQLQCDGIIFLAFREVMVRGLAVGLSIIYVMRWGMEWNLYFGGWNFEGQIQSLFFFFFF